MGYGQNRRRGVERAQAVIAAGMACLLLGSACSTEPSSPNGPSGASPDGGDECPSSWQGVDFTGAAPAANALDKPLGTMVQDTDGIHGVPDSSYADFINAHFKGGMLVALGKEAYAHSSEFWAAAGDLDPAVELGLTLDATAYRTVASLLAGLGDFMGLLPGGRQITTLVYQNDGGALSPAEIVELSQGMPSGVSLSVFGSIGWASPAPPGDLVGFKGKFTALVQTYGLLSHDCRAGEQVLVDGPAGGESVCARTSGCECTPAGTSSVYQLCKDAPAQAGRVIGYLASLKAVPVGGSLDGVEFIFSFAPGLEDPTLHPANWTPAQYAEFAAGFAQMVRAQTGVTSGGISMGAWDVTSDYASANGWGSE